VTAVLPDWTGRYWFVTRRGLVGTVDPQSGRIATRELAGEEIENSFAVGSGRRVHRLRPCHVRLHGDAASGRPRSRGAGIRSRHAPQGRPDRPGLRHHPDALARSGWRSRTTRAAPERARLPPPAGRGGDAARLPQPVSAGASATENTFVGFGHSLIVETTPATTSFPTMMSPHGAGGGRASTCDDGEGCHVVWQSGEVRRRRCRSSRSATGSSISTRSCPGAPWWTDA